MCVFKNCVINLIPGCNMKTIQKLQKRRGLINKLYTAFSLLELLIASIIFGIYALIVFLNLMPLEAKVKNGDIIVMSVFAHVTKSNFIRFSIH